LSPRYQLFSEATWKKIVGTEGTIKVLLPEYQVYKCFIILNNCAIQNSKLGIESHISGSQNESTIVYM
jgi:hypothetical protein